MDKKLFLFCISSLIITIICFLIYSVGQQIIRQGANDPQIEIAENIATALSHNQSIENFVPQQKIDMSLSLSPYILIFNTNGILTNSFNTTIHGKTPVVPSGLFSDAQNRGELRFTWQPEAGVRQAAVLVPYTSGFVFVGRSLREVEKREDSLLQVISIGWISLVFINAIAFVYIKMKKK